MPIVAPRTLIRAAGNWVQADRGALPAQAVFLVGEQRDAYLSGDPRDDGSFVSVVAHALEHTGGYTPEAARRAAGTLLPEILPYDRTRPASFPRNGRTLTDDAGDVFLAILTNGKVTGDKVGPHGDLLPEFPYLGHLTTSDDRFRCARRQPSVRIRQGGDNK
jgi:hypothetical protein